MRALRGFRDRDARSRVGIAARLVCWVLGAVLMAVGVLATVSCLRGPIGVYDEGILLTNAQLLMTGRVPYRDFYTNYPPGTYWLLVALWKVFGISPLVERALGLAVHLALALGSGMLAGRMLGRRMSWATVGVVLVWLVPLETVPYAWLIALVGAVAFCELCLRARAQPALRHWLCAGIALGSVGCFRHDLFIYLVLALGAWASLAWVAGGPYRQVLPSFRECLWVWAGAMLPLIALWGPTLALAPFRQIVDDLYRDQVHFVMPARTLPLPPLLPLVKTRLLPFPVPAFWADSWPGAVALVLAAPAVALLVGTAARRSILFNPLGVVLLGALASAVIPQMAGRSDRAHILLTVTPALILLCSLGMRPCRSVGNGWRSARAIAAIAGTAGVLLFPVRGHAPVRAHFQYCRPPAAQSWQAAFTRYAGLPEVEPARKELLEIIRAQTAENEPIFIGLIRHRKVFIDEMDLYFLANRPGATRYMQFDPNIINREDVQRRMIEELEDQKVRLAVLSSRFSDVHEPNESQNEGSGLLDDYLRSRFRVAASPGPYVVLVRNDSSP